MTERFSVCVPVSSETEGLTGSIESLLAQKHGGWELVIADNASEADVVSVIDHYDDRRIRHHRFTEALSGIEALNRACQLCASEWVFPLHIGDRLEPDCLSVMDSRISTAGSERLAAVIAGANPTLSPSPSTGREAEKAGWPAREVRQAVPVGLYDGSQWFEVMSKARRAPLSLRAVAYSREVLVESGWFRPDAGSAADLNLVLRVSAYGNIICVGRTLVQTATGSASHLPEESQVDGGRETALEAAWDLAIRAHSAVRTIPPAQLAAVKATIARSHIDRAVSHRLSSGGRGRREAMTDIWRAYSTRPGLLASPGALGTSALALLAPRAALTTVMNLKAGQGNGPGPC